MPIHRQLRRPAFALCLAFLTMAVPVVPGEVEFFLVERYLRDGLLLHFYTDPFRSYEVQYTTNLAVGQPGAGNRWTSIYRVDAVPFENHYVLFTPGTNTGPQRFYRLVATP